MKRTSWSQVERPPQICVACWEATPGHTMVRPFWTYCSHWRVLALRPPEKPWKIHRGITPVQATQSLREVLEKIYFLAPQWPQLKEQIVQLTRDLRDYEVRLLMEHPA